MPRRLMLLALPLLFSACVLDTRPEVADTMPLARPIGPQRRLLQRLQAFWPNGRQTLLCALELDDRHIGMAAFTEAGLSLFNLSFDGKRLDMDSSSLLSAGVAPAAIVGDLQLAFWPIAELRRSLPERWRLAESANSRSLYDGDRLYEQVRYPQGFDGHSGSVELTNFRFHYLLRITTLSYDAVSE